MHVIYCYRWKRRPRSQFLLRISILSDIRTSRNYAIHGHSIVTSRRCIYIFGGYDTVTSSYLCSCEKLTCHQESMLRVACASYLLIVLIVFSCIWICHSIDLRLYQKRHFFINLTTFCFNSVKSQQLHLHFSKHI